MSKTKKEQKLYEAVLSLENELADFANFLERIRRMIPPPKKEESGK